MNLVLKHNVFEFDEKFYLQIQGTAMGTKMAHAYANLFMGRLETKLINLASEFIHTWKRFIDDIFIIWTGTLKGTCQTSTKFTPQLNLHMKSVTLN